MKIIIIILQAILNLVRKRRDLIANRSKIPPEYRDDVVVWYSPKKQRLTNYDVIESYAEDFTQFIKNGNGTFTQNKYTSVVTTQEWLLYKTNSKEIEAMDIYVTSDASSFEQALRYYYIDEDKNRKIIKLQVGLNHLPASHYREQSSLVGIIFEKTPTNEFNVTITQLPTSILKDFSGNGLDAYMYGFAGKLNNGIGIYQTDFSSWNYYPSLSTVEYSPKGLVIKKVNSTAQFCASDFIGKFTAEVSGIPEGVSFYYRYIDKTTGSPVSTTLSNGINEVDCSNANGDANMTNMFLIGANNKDINITFVQIPDYPNSLCYAGKQYCKVYDLPDIDDYTIIARRTWFSKTSRNTFISNSNYAGDGGFIFEIFDVQGDTVYSFGNTNKVIFAAAGISYQTKTKYNDTTIATGTAKSSNTIWIGRLRDNDGIFNGCHDDIIILKRSLTINEINDITEAIFNETIIEE